MFPDFSAAFAPFTSGGGFFPGPSGFNFDFQNMPEMLAGQFSRLGISPDQFLANPSEAAQALAPPAPATPSLGESLVPLPTPDPRTAQAQAPQNPMSAFANSLKGLKAPAAPQAQKVSTPSAPGVQGIKGGELIALLQSLGGGAGGGAGGGLQLPPTLGAALSKFRGF